MKKEKQPQIHVPSQTETTAEIQTVSWFHTNRRFFIPLIVLIVLAGTLMGGLLVYADAYENKVLPGIYVGDVGVGGMTREELATFLKTMTDKLLHGEIVISAKDGAIIETIVAVPKDPTSSFVAATVDVEAAANTVFQYGKEGNIFSQAGKTLVSQLKEVHVSISPFITIDEPALLEAVQKRFSRHETPIQDAGIHITKVSPEGIPEFTITSSSPGIVFDYSTLTREITASWGNLQSANIVLVMNTFEPAIRETDVENITATLPPLFQAGPVVLTFTDPLTKQTKTWKIEKKQMTEWITVKKKETGELVFTLDTASTTKFLEEKIKATINVLPQDAAFTLNPDQTKAIVFVGARPGVTLNTEETYALVEQAFWATNTSTQKDARTVTVITAQVEPTTKTGDTNSLGIDELLGVGYSNFSGSPKNRIVNIKNAVKNKLQGTIVAPGAEFSLNKTLRPYTLEAGYVPELVIVGNRIKPEVAGGLCQVGTTMFRAAMNAGLQITARTNHGLVVHYYNDPANGNPGTDATIYDGWPDFRFINDTGHYVLIDTGMDTKTGILNFYIWGTSDGRKGSYSAPKVLKWIPAGPHVNIETTDLPPGTKQCQSVHNGADAAFTYTRIMPSGEKIEKVFTSHYRAVPSTCYVGVEAKIEPIPPVEGAPTEPAATPGTVLGEQVTSDPLALPLTDIAQPATDPAP